MRYRKMIHAFCMEFPAAAGSQHSRAPHAQKLNFQIRVYLRSSAVK